MKKAGRLKLQGKPKQKENAFIQAGLSLSLASQAVIKEERFRVPEGSKEEYMSSGGKSKKEINFLGICISRSGKAIMAVESSEQPKIAANSSIRGHNSYPLNLKT